jgi:Cd2+/Zn2+-exporting ATPase
MDCAEEVALLRGALSKLDGLGSLSFNVVQSRMTVEYDAERLDAARIEHAVQTTGMRCEEWTEGSIDDTAPERRGWSRESILTLISGLSLAIGMAGEAAHSENVLASLLVHDHSHHQAPGGALLFFLIAIVAGATPALPKALGALRQLRPDMNLLMVLSLTGACVLGEWTEAGTLSFLFALAGRLEHWSMGRARDAIRQLMNMAPHEATVLHGGTEHGKQDHGEHEHRVLASDVNIGARVRVRPGERVPCDGDVVRGASFVNQALITGESTPAPKMSGDAVFAGTINESGVLDIQTTRQHSDTTLARMVRMVEQSQARRAPAEQFVERFTRIYTPVVFLLAFSVMALPPAFGYGAWSKWFYEGMVILLISCPCALVISTPVSIVAALTALARRGVLVKGGAFLEEAARVRAFVFDKTGVLTQGRPEVRRIVPLGGRTVEDVLERLVSLELSSEHPIAQAVIDYARRQGVHALPAAGFRTIVGRGIESAEGFWAGSARLLSEPGQEHGQMGSLGPEIDRLSQAGEAVFACGQGAEVWALVTVTDLIRAESKRVAESLRSMGVERILILTGDTRENSSTVAAAIGADELRTDQLPGDKAARVRELRTEYKHVAVAGDGVNDAEALSSASLGISLGLSGADVAREIADVVLMSGDLHGLPFLRRHAQKTMAIVKENIGFAMGMKALFLVAAVAGVATLWMAVAADMGATFAVTLNGLRLLRAKEKE